MLGGSNQYANHIGNIKKQSRHVKTLGCMPPHQNDINVLAFRRLLYSADLQTVLQALASRKRASPCDNRVTSD